jgi:hypothetical protein
MAEETTEESQEAEEKDELTSALEGSQDESNEDESNEDEGSEQSGEETGETETTEKAGEIEGEGGEEKEEGEKEPDLVKTLQGEVKDLRQMVRTSKRELTITQAKLERLGERRTKANDEDEDDEDDEGTKGKTEKKESLSTVEELQQSISNIGASKGAALDVLLEAMEQNTKYEDIREVCSRENFDDIFEVIATDATKKGGNFDEVLLEVELNVWSKANPYRYMYDLIKKYHPSYSTKKDIAGPGDKKGKMPVKAEAPGTIADKGGDSNLKSGWTAKRIDDLPEDELHTVPREIYERYMKDELK